MNLNLQAHAAIRVNGKEITSLQQVALKQIPIALGKFLIALELDGRDFSNLELRISKRPIVWDSEDQILDEAAMSQIQLVDPFDPIDSESPPITYLELQELSSDPIWTSYKSLTLKSNLESMDGDTIERIRHNWFEKYGHTKFTRLI